MGGSVPLTSTNRFRQPVARELAPTKRGNIVAAVWSPGSRTIAYDRS
jgi:hypothetical protein